MKHLIRNLSIYFFNFSGLAFLRKRYLARRTGSLVRVVCFHRVTAGEVESFRNKLSLLRERFHIISLDDLFHKEKLSTKKTNIAITFDDGFRDLKDHISAVLEELALPATFFIPSAFVGISPSQATNFSQQQIGIPVEDTLSLDELKGLTQSPLLSLGGHTRSHVDVGKISNYDILYEEIVGAKTDREQIAGTRLKHFAFPFGSQENVSEAAIKTLERGGFQTAFTIIPGFNTLDSNRYRLHRDSLSPTMNTILFLAWLEGSYDLFKCISDRIRLWKEWGRP